MRYQLTPADRDCLTELWRRMRTATTKANSASTDWNRVNDELNNLAERSGWDDLKTAQVKGVNMRLNDAYGAWNFWQQETRRLAATLQAELAARTMFGLVDADEPDETGLLYQRDDADDEPVRRPTKPHVGFSLISPERAARAARRRNSHPHAGEADARLDTTAPAVVREAPTGVAAPVGAGDRSPAGPSQSPGRPGPQPSGARAGARASGTGSGGTVAGAAVPPALRGGGGVW